MKECFFDLGRAPAEHIAKILESAEIRSDIEDGLRCLNYLANSAIDSGSYFPVVNAIFKLSEELKELAGRLDELEYLSFQNKK